MGKPLIAVDVDDVLLDFIPSLLKYCNLKFGTTSEFEDFSHYELQTNWKCTPEEVFERVYSFYNSEEFKSLPSLKDAYKTLNNLSDDYDFVVISSRPLDTYAKTSSSLDRLFPGIFREYYLTGDFKKEGLTHGKGKLCRQLGVYKIIDDSYSNALDCVNSGIGVLLYERPWNKNIEIQSELIQKVASWEEVFKVCDLTASKT